MERKIEDIIIDLLAGEKLSPEDRGMFEVWYANKRHRKDFYEWQQLHSAIRVNNEKLQINTEEAWRKTNRKPHPTFRLKGLLKYAAVLLLPVCCGLSYFLLHKQDTDIQIISEIQVVPGKKQAVLTLSDGKTVNLTDSLITPIVHEKGVIIHNTEKNVLAYSQEPNISRLAYNTITVPRGGEYMLSLADGTNVWLNSETRITYPVSFTGATREVSIEGEAYFNVHKDQSKPFIVHTQQFNIRVTGTQFNIRTYPDDTKSATLVEGKIQLERHTEVHLLRPGEQATLQGETVNIHEADIESVLAWQHEAFSFKQCRLENLLNEMARWYDIDIFYQNPETKEYHFSAWFHRCTPIEEVIQILEKTGKIKMQLKGRTLTVATNRD